MSKITAITAGKSRQKKLNISLDSGPALSLLVETALKEGLVVGQELSSAEMERLAGADRLQRCYNAAVRFLGCRPRSEAEIRQRLIRQGFDGETIGKTLSKLREQGLADDAAFARFWKESRETFSPRSRRLTGLELRRKGLEGSVIEGIIGDVDDRDSAYRAALGKARRLQISDYRDFRHRLGDYLRRRGFDYDIINETVGRVWREYGAAPDTG